MSRPVSSLEPPERQQSPIVHGLAGVTAVILAGGLGTRLRPVLADRPKVLAPVRGRPFMAYLLDQLADYAIRRAVVCTGYLGEQIPAAFGEMYRGIHLTYSCESSPLGTAGAIRLALPHLDSSMVLAMNGDSYCAANLSAFWHWHSAQEGEATILLRWMSDTRRYGRVNVDDGGRVLRFEEKYAAQGPGWVSGGIYLLSQRLIRTIPARQAVSLERETFPAWVRSGLRGYRSSGGVVDIGTPESYAALKEALMSRSKSAHESGDTHAPTPDLDLATVESVTEGGIQ